MNITVLSFCHCFNSESVVMQETTSSLPPDGQEVMVIAEVKNNMQNISAV